MMDELTENLKLVENRDAMDLVPASGVEVWWFLALGAGLLVACLIALMLWKRSRKEPLAKDRGLAYREALKELSSLDSSDLKETAARVSLILRGYLAKHLGEPALYETHEEFVSRHDALKQLPESTKFETRAIFLRLAEWKYGPSGGVSEGVEELKREAVELLERIHKS